ncbi:gluconokinase [Quadrisphaera oryzae]|uniref:gluconokinase n=1 Tax=Quadrisphaera TaxID=317661 RepID=UPI001646B36E|nr:gluconokinase [Quadrisphaera sp. RL12-1S]MBC3760230.1 gluconokinase [Quadrisphaera sp. RL12-1S]
MGVSGSGKTTVAQLLAQDLGWTFAEADDFHPPANVAKMESGHPLTDEDRWPWLRSLRDWADERAEAGEDAVVTCSALKRSYRDLLRGSRARVRFVHLDGPPELLAQRIGGRTGHFMPSSLLGSQLEALEPLGADEDGAVVSIDATPQECARAAAEALGL